MSRSSESGAGGAIPAARLCKLGPGVRSVEMELFQTSCLDYKDLMRQISAGMSMCSASDCGNPDRSGKWCCDGALRVSSMWHGCPRVVDLAEEWRRLETKKMLEHGVKGRPSMQLLVKA